MTVEAEYILRENFTFVENFQYKEKRCEKKESTSKWINHADDRRLDDAVGDDLKSEKTRTLSNRIPSWYLQFDQARQVVHQNVHMFQFEVEIYMNQQKQTSSTKNNRWGHSTSCKRGISYISTTSKSILSEWMTTAGGCSCVSRKQEIMECINAPLLFDILWWPTVKDS